jgi:hypothetical protein
MIKLQSLFCVLGVCLFPFSAAAQGWQFSAKVGITGPVEAGIFHHLDGAGRKHIALSDSSLAVTWEDDRTGDPQVYVATKTLTQDKFSTAIQVSTGAEAYEPAITALANDRFVIAWEQDGSVYTSLLQRQQLTKPLKLSLAIASQVSLTSMDQQVYAVWREEHASTWFLKVARINADNDQLQTLSVHPVEKETLKQPVLYPAIALGPAGLSVAWEDRRNGHTRLLFSHSNDAGVSFTGAEHLNEFYSNRNAYDKGSGVTRVSISALSEEDVLAAWMDKRRGGAGYGIFAAFGDEGGQSFGPNEKVHGKKGDTEPHYNPSTAGNAAGDFVVAWDDFRSGDSDIWLSTYNEDGEWSEDFAPPTAAGKGEQTHASVTMDAGGGLHLIWIERADPLSPSRLWYSLGLPAD